ncbi:hypothetical protein D3C85_1216990 [compost metagenome]
MPRLEVAFTGGAGEAVPRADNLAVIATEHPVADQWPQVFRDRAFEFDGQVGNAASGIQHIGADEGVGRADVEAGTAPPAVFGGMGRVDRQRQVDEQFGEKKVTAGLAVQDQGIFADPSKPRLFGDGFFQHRGTVDKSAEAERSDLGLNFFRQLLHAFADQLVVIATQGITRDVGFFRLGEHFCHLRVAGQVIHA